MSQTYQKSNDAFTVIDQKYLNTEQAAKYLCVTEYTMRKYANAGLIPYYRDWETDRKSTRLNSSHSGESRMPSSA